MPRSAAVRGDMMWVRASLPAFGEGSRATVARLHAREGDHVQPGGLLLDLDVDLSGGVVRDCPPVSTCRIVLREALWLRRLFVHPADAVSTGAVIAEFSAAPDTPPEAMAREARVALVAVVHHPDWWSDAP